MRYVLFSLILCTAAAPALSANVAEGKKIVANNCVSCHDDSYYKRQNRRVKSLSQLTKQVNRCQLSQGLNWFDDDIENAVAYLNKTYYRFK